ncbi:MAG: sensor histidine kinase [Anaerolineae bacterium]|nr:sensor histidine kinase [Anaerolineae bacterium]
MEHAQLPSKINLRHKLVFLFVLVTLFSMLVAESAAFMLFSLALPERQWSIHIVVVSLVAAVVGGALGVWASGLIDHRLRRIAGVGRAWLRGNLAARIADPVQDDLGLLAEQLDLLAEHLEHDEQDLEGLREQNTRLTDQTRALAVVEERNRLARELHDSVKQYLFSLAMTAGGLRARFDTLLAGRSAPAGGAFSDDELVQMSEMVREVETTAQAAQREMTRLIRDLKPGTLEEQGLGAALNDYALLFGAREHILAYVDVQGNDAILSPSVAEALYRVAQEALHNVARHARATRVDVRLRCLPEQVILTVRDNGVGFDPQQAQRGLGLANMQERMMSIGGQASVEGRLGRGTTVTARVALAHPVSVRPDVSMSNQERPKPRIENWGWLGQKLVIPVGQTWPWLPADQIYLRQPLVEPDGEAVLIGERRSGIYRKKRFAVQRSQQRVPLVQIRRIYAGYAWRSGGATWTLHYTARSRDWMVLARNNQPLAALQSQGRLMNAWSELVYDDRGYRLACLKEGNGCALIDQEGNEILAVRGGNAPQIELKRAIPLPLLAMVAARVVDDAMWMSNVPQAAEAVG